MEQRMARDDLDIPAPTYRVPARRRILDMDTRRLALFAGFAACGIALVVSVWTALAPGRGGPAPLVAADGRPLKVRPENPGGMQAAGQNDDIMASGRSGARLAPAPEAPAPNALRERQAAAEAARLEVARLEAARQEAARVEIARQEAARQEMARLEAARQETARLEEGRRTQPVRPQNVALAPVGTASQPSVAAPGARKAAAQLGSLPTEQAAKQEWQRLAKKLPDIFGGRQPQVVKADRDGKVLWRLRTGGFADQAQAMAFCDRVKAKGANCAVTVF